MLFSKLYIYLLVKQKSKQRHYGTIFSHSTGHLDIHACIFWIQTSEISDRAGNTETSYLLGVWLSIRLSEFILCNLYKDMNGRTQESHRGIVLKEFCLCGMWKHSKIEASGKSQFILSQKRLFPWELLEVMAIK